MGPPRAGTYHSTTPHVLGHQRQLCRLANFTAPRRHLPQHTQAAAGPTRTSAKNAE